VEKKSGRRRSRRSLRRRSLHNRPGGTPLHATPTSSIRLDVASAYVASAARIGVWIAISGLVYRFIGREAFALLALVRGSVGLLGYVAAGIGPATITLLAGVRKQEGIPLATALADRPVRRILSYYGQPDEPDTERTAYWTASAISLTVALAGMMLVVVYGLLAPSLHVIPRTFRGEVFPLVLCIGLGVALRLLSEPAGAVLQTRQAIVRDNLCIAAGELLWLVAVAASVGARGGRGDLVAVAVWYAASGLAVLLLRRFLASRLVGPPQWKIASPALAWQLLQFGGLLILAQLADFLYAPADYIIINRLIAAPAVADYAPAVQIATGLLLLSGGIAAVLLPRSAVAHAAGNVAQLRRYYWHGTLISAAILAAACATVYLLSPWLLEAWLGSPMPATQAILPLMLLGTLLGGCGAVGNAVLLGAGQLRAHAASALVTGTAKVILTIIFIAGLGLGLQGAVLATVLAVGVRSGIWLPWYLNRILR
jgi:O-antigen/teichoic acid export membrane protein